jgi:translation initiation factor 1
MKQRRTTHDDPPRGLSHRPFAALRPKGSSEPAATSATPPAATPSDARIVVRREKKGRAGKTITRVAGLCLEATTLEKLTRDLKRALGCGASIEDGEIVLQGAMCERAAEWLRARTGADVIVGN